MNLAYRYIFAALTATLMVCLAACGSKAKAHFDVDREEFPVKGIDVSAHNGEVDFDKAKEDSVMFVYMKATEGANFCDASFERNHHAAIAAGLLVGAYHFFRFDSPGSEQAENFLTAVDSLPLHLPLAIDVEDFSNPKGIAPRQVAAELRAMADTLIDHGFKVMVYTNKKGMVRYVAPAFGGSLPIWIASPSRRPRSDNWTLWQHSHKGEVKGVNGPVDLNTFNGTPQEFQEWAAGSTVNQLIENS